MAEVTLHRINELLTLLNSKIKSERIKSATSLQDVKIFPQLVNNIDELLNKYIVQIISHLDDESDAVREKSAKVLGNFLKQIGIQSLDAQLITVMPSLYQRLLKEPVEEVSVLLIEIVLYFVELIGPDTFPASWDNYSEMTFSILSHTFKASDPRMKVLSSSVLIKMSSKCVGYSLKPLAGKLILSIIPNLKHRQQDVRKSSLAALAELYALTHTEDHTDKVFEIIQKLSDDRAQVVRLAVIGFCETLLTKHDIRHVFYSPFCLPLLFSIYPIVPPRPVFEGETLPKIEETLESKAAYDSLVKIGLQHEKDKAEDYRNELQYTDTIMFDNEREISHGLKHIIQDMFVKFMDNLLPMLSDWTEQTRLFGFRSIISLLYMVKEYSTRYAPQILTALATSIRDIRGDNDIAMRCAAMLSSNVPGIDLVMFLAPRLTNEGPKEIVMLITACLTNSTFNDGELATIMTAFNNNRVYEAINSLDYLAQAVLAMIARSVEFREINTHSILTIILRICEKADALHHFENCFDRPLATVFSEQMSTLLTVGDKTPKFLSHLLLTVPSESVMMNIGHVNQSLCMALESETESKTAIYQLVSNLCKKGSLSEIDDPLLEKLISDIAWRAGKEYVPLREAATIALGDVIEYGALSVEVLDANIEKVLPMILSSLDDSWSDVVRVAGAVTAKKFLIKSTSSFLKFDDVYAGIRQRLDDHLISIRIMAAECFGIFLPKCRSIEIVPSKWKELLLFIDDENPEIREAIYQMIVVIGKAVPEWKESLSSTISEMNPNNYHKEATELGERALIELA